MHHAPGSAQTRALGLTLPGPRETSPPSCLSSGAFSWSQAMPCLTLAINLDPEPAGL